MQIGDLLEDDGAVSPVIGVILMVAITVILAAVIATFVLGLGEQVTSTAPNASFTFDYNDSAPGSGTDDIGSFSGADGNLTIIHAGGPNIDPGSLSVVDSINEGSWSDAGYSDDVSAGNEITVAVQTGETIRIAWENDAGTGTAVLQAYEVPS